MATEYRVIYQGMVMTNPGTSRRDAQYIVNQYANTGKTVIVEKRLRSDPWGGWLQVDMKPSTANRSGGRITYTVATIDPYTQRRTSRLGRQVSKREAMKIADLWERNGAKDVCVIDSRGIIHRQPINHPVNQNRSGMDSNVIALWHTRSGKVAAEVKRYGTGAGWIGTLGAGSGSLAQVKQSVMRAMSRSRGLVRVYVSEEFENA